MFDDPAVDKEVFVRTKLLKIYNKRENDFRNSRVLSTSRQIKILIIKTSWKNTLQKTRVLKVPKLSMIIIWKSWKI